MQDPPAGSETEAYVRMEYAVSYDGGLTWTEMGTFPAPSGSGFEADPTLAPVLQSGTTGSFVGAGFGAFAIEMEESYSALMHDGSDVFDGMSLDHFDGCEVRYGRLGSGVGPVSSGSETHVYLFGRSVDPDGVCAEEGQIVTWHSADSGHTWGAMEPLSIGGVAIKGFPSEPVLDFRAKPYFSHSNVQGVNVDAAFVDFLPTVVDLQTGRTRELAATAPETYFELTDQHIAGSFDIAPFSSIATNAGGIVYLVYHDAADGAAPDADFNIYLLKGVEENGVYTWSTTPTKINGGSGGAKRDQFMPAMILDGSGDLHVAWYDTRNDPKSPGQDVTIDLYYAKVEDDDPLDPNSTFTITEVRADDEAISTAYLSNPNFIGDFIDLEYVFSDDGTKAVLVVYTGTQHPIQQDPNGMDGLGGPVIHQQNEAIFSILIDQ